MNYNKEFTKDTNELQITVFEQDGKLLADSREVALAIGKPHNDLMKSIRGYCKNLNEGEISPVELYYTGQNENNLFRKP